MSNQPDPRDWRARARCKGMDPDLFFPDVGVTGHAALKICKGGCPVLVDCLLEALWAPQTWSGIWGGTTERQRRSMRRQGPSSWPRLDGGLPA